MHLGIRRAYRRCAPGSSRSRFVARGWAETLESRQLLSTTGLATVTPAANIVATPLATASGGFTVTAPLPGSTTPSQILSAYGGTGLGDGSGQTIAIIDAYGDPNIAADLHTFDQQYGLPDLASTKGSAPSLTVVNQTGGQTPPPVNASWTLETSLDVEWAHAIAPKANILLVQANSSSISDLMQGVDYARHQAGVSVVSMSWGAPEAYLGQGIESQYDSYFTTPAGSGSTPQNGITFVASSGDDGGLYGPSWPAASPNVVSVGGSTLPLNSNGTLSAPETAWFGSSGGVSSFEAEPSYQNGVQSTGSRTTPDVAYSANPRDGFAVYDSTRNGGVSGWFQVGGTSAGTPQWAALVAQADQIRVSQGQTTLNGATQTLPALYQAGTSAYHQITSGNNFWYGAGSGYNAVTGLGSPVDSKIVSALASFGVHASPVTKAVTVSPAATVSAQPFDQTITVIINLPSSSSGSSGGQVVDTSRRGSGNGGSTGSSTTTVVIFLSNPFGFNQQPVSATAPAVFSQSLFSTTTVQQSALPPVAQPLLTAGRRIEPAVVSDSTLVGGAPGESPEEAPPIFDLPDPKRDGEANPVVAGIPASIWDAALESLYGDDRELAVPIRLADDLHPIAPMEHEADPSLGTSLLAGAAATFWLIRAARRDKSRKPWVISLPN